MLVIKYPLMHGMVGFIVSSISQHYSHLNTIVSSVFGDRQVISSMLRGHQTLCWWLTSSPKSKRCLGGSVGVGNHLFPRSNLFYWVSYHITLFLVLQWWKGGGTFLQVYAPFVCSLTFPHAMAKASLMHCSPVLSHWIPRVHNRCKGLKNFGFCKN